MQRYVIHYKNLPYRLPLNFTAITLLSLDRLHAHPAIWGGAIVLLVLFWARCIYGLFKQKYLKLHEQKSNRSQAQTGTNK